MAGLTTAGGEEVVDNDSITSDMPEEMITAMFDDLYQKDEVLQQMLGGTTDYDLNEKLSILQAYKKGGGVAGLADIIDESEDDEGAQQQQMKQNQEQMQAMADEEEIEEEMDLDLNNPEDVKIIHTEFQKLYDADEQFRDSFGPESLEL